MCVCVCRHHSLQALVTALRASWNTEETTHLQEDTLTESSEERGVEREREREGEREGRKRERQRGREREGEEEEGFSLSLCI